MVAKIFVIIIKLIVANVVAFTVGLLVYQNRNEPKTLIAFLIGIIVGIFFGFFLELFEKLREKKIKNEASSK